MLEGPWDKKGQAAASSVLFPHSDSESGTCTGRRLQ